MTRTLIHDAFDLPWRDQVASDLQRGQPLDIDQRVGQPRRTAERLAWSASVAMLEMTQRIMPAKRIDFEATTRSS